MTPKTNKYPMDAINAWLAENGTDVVCKDGTVVKMVGVSAGKTMGEVCSAVKRAAKGERVSL